MFCGSYTSRLNRRGCFVLPKAYRRRFSGSANSRDLCFAAGDTLRLYPEDRLPPYKAEMERLLHLCGRADAAPLLALTQNHGDARLSRFGRLTIPAEFLAHYGLAPGSKLLLLGEGDFIEIRPLQEHPLHSGALRQALDVEEDFISELDALEVTSLDIRYEASFDTAGLLPFKNLFHLTLADCGLEDAGFVAAFQKLAHLSLSGNHIEDFSPVARLSRLKSLNIAGNPAAALPFAGSLKLLEELNATGCQIAGLPPLPADCRIRTLQLNDNRLKKLGFLEPVSTLENLCLDGNRIEDLTPLAGMQKLRHLHIANNRVADITPLLALPGLWGADVAGNPLAAGEERRLAVHTLLSAQSLEVVGAQVYDKKRRDFVARHAAALHSEALAGLLFALTHLRRVERALPREGERRRAEAHYP